MHNPLGHSYRVPAAKHPRVVLGVTRACKFTAEGSPATLAGVSVGGVMAEGWDPKYSQVLGILRPLVAQGRESDIPD